jgi:hypothetical protein
MINLTVRSRQSLLKDIKILQNKCEPEISIARIARDSMRKAHAAKQQRRFLSYKTHVLRILQTRA